MKFLYLIAIVVLISKTSCQNQKENGVREYEQNSLTQYVNPFVGTKNMGHTFPGATVPFGMVQLSPETDQQPMFTPEGEYNKETYRYCAGYQYEDSTIFGFSHTHFSGTGHSDLGDILIMPTTGKLTLNPGDKNIRGSGYHSLFRHETEEASPGYYKVRLDDYNVKAEMTATKRVGVHRYTFQESDTAHLLLDMISNIYNYDGKNVWTFLRVENDTLVTGYRQTNGWARTRKVFFAVTFSKPFVSYGHRRYEDVPYNGFYRKFDEAHNFPEMAGRKIRAWFDFSILKKQEILVKVALSPVSTAGAIRNMQKEMPGWDFESAKVEADRSWNKELNKIQVEMSTSNQKESFYTAMYHTMLSPVIYEDVDGQYRGLDQNIHTSDGFTNYTIFSLWDTYRALHPLFNLIQPQRNNDMIHSMLAHHDQSVHHALPVWSHYANENWCMVGYHSVSVIADAMVKGTTDINPGRALQAAQNSSTLKYYDGLGAYMQYGYVPEDISSNSVSKTLEYAYDDWCIAQIADKAENREAEKKYLHRSKYYHNVYHKRSGYMRPKLSDGSWRKDFDPIDTHGQGFIEGNAWNYGLYVPHEVDTMIAMMGGKDAFSRHLDRIFTTPIDEDHIAKNEDITRDGIIGNYVHGNEPGHHIPYLYNRTNDAWKTQARVRMIMDTMYGNGVDGLCGNDDAGQMSAWYIFSALGFYPVVPGSNEYEIGSPLVKEAKICLDNGNILEINAKNQGDENVFVKSVTLNGKPVRNNRLDYMELKKGGELIFVMSDKHP